MKQNRLTVSYEGKPCYDIVLEQDYGQLAAEAARLDIASRKLCIVTDSNVGALYAKQVAEVLQTVAAKVVVFTFEAGEHSKTLDTVQNLYEFLIMEGFDRNDVLAALGGGVVGDLTGYAAATYLRGVRFFQLPTSLLAMVDSSIGGKTGVDFRAYKNMIGAFYMPQFVYMNISALNSLEEREYVSGYGEIIKHGLIKDAALYQWLKENRALLLSKEAEAMTELVYRSLLVKKEVVENDPKEKGERALLNFGHTLGHAVEKLLDFKRLHGECVAIGMAAAVYISLQRGMLTKEEVQDILSVLQAYKLPTATEGLSTEDILLAASRDKKMDAGKIKFILLTGIGSSCIDTTVTAEELQAACKFILQGASI